MGHQESKEYYRGMVDRSLASLKDKVSGGANADRRPVEFSMEELSQLGDIPATGDFTETSDLLLLKDQLGEVLAGLTSRQKTVMQLRYGLEDGRIRTLEETGKAIGRSKSSFEKSSNMS